MIGLSNHSPYRVRAHPSACLDYLDASQFQL
jgi:hypothetical protein